MTRQTTHEDNAAPEKMFHCHCALSLKKFQSTIVISKLPDKKDNTSVDMELLLRLVVFWHTCCRHHLFSLEFRQELDEDLAHYLRGPHLLQQVRNCAQLSAVQLCAIVRNCAIVQLRRHRTEGFSAIHTTQYCITEKKLSQRSAFAVLMTCNEQHHTLQCISLS